MAKRKNTDQEERELEDFVNMQEPEAFVDPMADETLKQFTAGDHKLGHYAYVAQLRQCWNANDPTHRDTANLILDKILNEDPYESTRLDALKALGKESCPVGRRRPVFCVDLTGAGIRCWPRDFIDRLALTLVHSRRRLGVCLAENCEHPYFISCFPRQHYCSDECLSVGRRASKRSWAKMNYDKKFSSPAEFGTRDNAGPIARLPENQKKSSSRKEKK